MARSGDARYGLNITAFHEENYLHGVQISYGGGAGLNGTLHTHLRVYCNESMEYEKVWYRGWAKQNQTHFTFVAESREACLQDHVRYGIAGGIFLQIVFLVAVCYFVIGGAVAWALGAQVPIPNYEFWQEVAKSIGTSVNFVAHCGKVSVGLSYDKI